jgi:DMSO/TMAO reductase YedYZ molybdopterin-dependent catalytic subunit
MTSSTAPRATRRAFLAQAGLAMMAGPALAEGVDFAFPGGVGERPITTAFPQKGPMVLQRARPPLLETPFEAFDRGVFTPNDRFFVRWHWAGIPTTVDPGTFRLVIDGHVDAPVSLSMDDLVGMKRVEFAAVNQCSGNSRGFFQPRVAGGEWGNGAMGNARWGGVSLRDVLARARIKAGAQRVRFGGLDQALVPAAPPFLKSLDLDHANDGEVMLAYEMNDAPLPLLNGFPLRLVVPGWYSTYWIKMLNRIEVLDGPDENFWMKTAYTIPDTPGATMKPGEAGVKMVPINAMVPRSFITNLVSGATVKAGAVPLRGIAFGGNQGVKAVDVSTDKGASWTPATLGRDEGKYSFRGWETTVSLPAGEAVLMVRCTNTDGLTQPMAPNWNPSGFMRNVVETTTVQAA